MRHYNIINQKSNNDCAVACLMMILRYYKVNIDYDKLKKELKTDNEGTSAYDIVRISKKYGLKAVGYKNYKINKVTTPVIALVLNKGIQHFIVIYKVKKKSIIIADPAAKIVEIDKEYFKKYYTGIIIKFINKTPKKNKYSLILYYFILNILLIFFNLILLIIISNFLNVIEMKKKILLEKYIVLFIILFTIKNIMDFIREKSSLKLRVIIDKKITFSFIYRLLSSKSNILKTNLMGDFASKYYDLNYIKEFYYNLLSTYSINILFLMFAFVSLFIFNYKISLLVLFYIIINISFNYKFYSKHYYLILDNQNQKGRYFSDIFNVINNIFMIKRLKRENYFYNNIKQKYYKYINQVKKIEKIFAKKNLFSDYLYMLFLIILITFLYYSNMTISNTLYIYSLTMIVINAIDDFIVEMPKFMNFRAIRERLNNLAIVNNESEGHFKNNQIDSLVIDNNDCILMYKISEVQKNEILYKLNKKHKKCSYVSLDENIIDDSLRNNIFLGKRFDRKIFNVCLINKIIKKYNLDYNKNIKDMSIKLLVEEKIKIFIARYVVNSNNIIIFDRIFDLLDESEAISIVNNIRKYKPKLTIIVFSDKNYRCKIFNKILVFKENKYEIRKRK